MLSMVPMARFDSVCEELNNALKREQQAQALLHEQTAQMQEMGERLELHANQGEEKDVTLAEAVKVLCIHSVIVPSCYRSDLTRSWPCGILRQKMKRRIYAERMRL